MEHNGVSNVVASASESTIYANDIQTPLTQTNLHILSRV